MKDRISKFVALCIKLDRRVHKALSRSRTWFSISGWCLVIALGIYIFKVIAELNTSAHYMISMVSVIALMSAGLALMRENRRRKEWVDHRRRMIEFSQIKPTQ